MVANLSTTPYSPVVETVKNTRLFDDERKRKCYLSPKEKSSGKMSFMERMRERNLMQSRVLTETGSSSKSKHKIIPKKDKDSPFEHLKCSPAMRKFISSEFRREKAACNFLPEKQVALAVIHRYKSYIANSNNKYKCTNSKKQPLTLRGKSKTKKIGKRKVPVGESGSLENSDDEQFEIEEFDECNLPVPAEGSFSLNPSPAQMKLPRQ